MFGSKASGKDSSATALLQFARAFGIRGVPVERGFADLGRFDFEAPATEYMSWKLQEFRGTRIYYVDRA
jgi:hypothetical protein